MADEYSDVIGQDIHPPMTGALAPSARHERHILGRHELEQRLVAIDLERASLKASRKVAKAVLSDATAMTTRAQAALAAAQERARQLKEQEALLLERRQDLERQLQALPSEAVND